MKKIILNEDQFKNYCRLIKNGDSKKIYLSEEQFNALMSKTFICEDISSPEIKSKRDIILNKINGVFNGKKGKDSRQYLRDKAKRTGINPDFKQKQQLQTREEIFPDLNFSPEINEKIKKIALILRKYVKNGGYFDAERLEQDYPKEFYELMSIKRFMDSQGMTNLYDTELGNNDNFGLNSDNNYNIDNFDINKKNIDINKYNDKGKKTKAEAILRAKQSVVDDYLNKVYGTQIDLPNSVFSNGNAKLSEQTLQINFASALGCPAWNECIVRYACYARSGEKQHRDVFQSNAERNVMWEAAHEDPTLINDIWELLRLYVVDYNKISSIANKSVEELSKIKFADLPEDVLSNVKENLRITQIRLNENGDFIGQWILDAFDEIAGDFNTIGVNTSAYTCRLLNFEKIQNIIINASKTTIKGKSVARYFFAVTEEMYNAFDETYSGENNALVLENGKVKMNPQALYNPETREPNGMYYYKCPCDREINKGDKILCNQCGVCYEPNTLFSQPYYVLVKAHGGSKNEFKGRIPTFGVSKNYNLPIRSYSTVMEEVSNNIKTAINTVANNGINSMKQHLNGLAIRK